MPVVRIVKYPHQHRVYCRPESRHIVKAVPGARWNADPLMRCWTIPTMQLRTCEAFFTSEGYEVHIVDGTARPRVVFADALPDWASHAFRVLGCELFEDAFKALTRVVHPDMGGSTQLQQDLNVARDRTRKECGCE